MEIKRYIPEVAAVGISEAVATIAAVKSAVDGNPQNINELFALYGFATFYVGVPAALFINVARNLYLYYKASNTSQGNDLPQE